ncbi:MAG TPA: hypothetical protein PLF31_02880 [Candidatus Paceibacterota bacterium]|nr:hypothetical protein [Candidatus Paceibacterota bacterium]
MEPLLFWQTHEYEPRNHSADWYWIVTIISIALVVICVLLGNWSLGIVLGLGAAMLAFLTTQHPELVDVGIYEKGIQVRNLFYPYETLDSFAVVEKEYIPKLIIKSKKFFLPYTIVKITGYPPETVEEVISRYIPEDSHAEPLLYKLLDYIGF